MTAEFNSAKRILFAPLNWGLGHATRSAVIIQQALDQNKEVAIASDGLALELLKSEFPQCTYFELPSYNISYGEGSFTLAMLSQLSKIRTAIRNEHQRLSEIITAFKPELIVSDNRYGIWDKQIHSILLTHQLQPHHSTALLRSTGKSIINRLARPFHEIWVPDHSARLISGSLSYSDDSRVKYIGPLSRLEIDPLDKKSLDLVLLLSGPEPGRTIFETKLLSALSKYPGSIALVRGNNKSEELDFDGPVYPLADKPTLEQLLASTKAVICRSGYSSIMDLFNLAAKKIIVPTPGQTEQEYLAEHLDGSSDFISLAEHQIETQLEKMLNGF